MYRIWDTKLNKEFEPDYRAHMGILEDITMRTDGTLEMRTHNKTLDSSVFNADQRYITQQCTGLKDKNGVLIYQGDVVRFIKDRDGNTIYVTMQYKVGAKLNVIWCDRYKCFDLIDYNNFEAESETIGNYRHNGMLEIIGNIMEDNNES